MPIFPVQKGQKRSPREILAALILHTELISGRTSQIRNSSLPPFRLADGMVPSLEARLKELEEIIGD